MALLQPGVQLVRNDKIIKYLEAEVRLKSLPAAQPVSFARSWYSPQTLGLCYFYGVHVYPTLPLVPHSPQHVLCNTHSFMQFSVHTNHFQHSFFLHVTALLPSAITSAPSLSVFMHYL